MCGTQCLIPGFQIHQIVEAVDQSAYSGFTTNPVERTEFVRYVFGQGFKPVF